MLYRSFLPQHVQCLSKIQDEDGGPGAQGDPHLEKQESRTGKG